MIVRLTNGPLARMLHFALYERMVTFCQKHTPEFPAETIVSTWLERLYKGDPQFHILLYMEDNYTILAHAVVAVEEQFGERIVHTYQGQSDKGATMGIAVFNEMIDKIAAEAGASKAGFFLDGGRSKALERFGYKVYKTYMMKVYDSE